MPPNDEAAIEVSSRDYSYQSGPTDRAALRPVVVEAPINILFGGVGFAVMMATPQDLEDFAYGFALTEGIIEGPRDIRGVEVTHADGGLKLDITLVGERMSAHLARGRALSGRTGCGLCGIADLAQLPQPIKAATPRAPIAPSSIMTALQAIERGQTLNARTRAAHGAAWCDQGGALVALREDVGRHNALDKLIGALIRRGLSADNGFLVITSRCSFEMVAKAAIFGASTLVALSAPTSLALERAAACGLTLIALARADHATIFAADAAPARQPKGGGLAA
ncbi:MAG TPA: formate dehydrogenase accessory sulfurtransferase FdhD [Roseiarcus sp.]|nr:formate dehydrogenase accessory sulfurtransferase FdhD [Roseiarcus sp.]